MKREIIKLIGYDGENPETAYNNILKLYKNVVTTSSIENIVNDIDMDILTCNEGRDGNKYFWYAYNDENVCINADTGAVIDEEKEISDLFY